MVAPRLSRLFLGMCGFSLMPLVLAQNPVETTGRDDIYHLSLAELGQIQISIATGNATAVDRAPATASVITAAEIEAMGARTLDDILMQVPGLHVSLSSLSRIDSLYSIRGIHTGFNAQVLLLINGVPLQYALQGGRPPLSRLAAANIERVEVVRGPGSAIYGADAYAGVINVVTRDAVGMEDTEAGARAGSFDTREVWARTGLRWQDWLVNFHLAYQETDGDKGRIVDHDLQSVLDEILGTGASFAPGPLATGYQMLDMRLSVKNETAQGRLWYWRTRDAQVGAGGANALDPIGEDNAHFWLLDFEHQLPLGSDDWQHRLNGQYLDYRLDARFVLFPAGAVLPIGSDGNLNLTDPRGMVYFPEGMKGNPASANRDAHLFWVSNYEGWERHRLRIAVGYRYQDLRPSESKNFGPGVLDGTETEVGGELVDVTGTPYIFIRDSRRSSYYLSLQDEWQWMPDWVLTAGLRWDRYSDFGSTINPRMALVWTANDRLTAKLLYGSAFRAPAFSERLFVNNPVSLGNPNLKPERIDTYELSFNYRFAASLQTNLTLFNYRAWDMIEFVPDPDATTSTAQNARDQDATGAEWEWQWKPSSRFWLSGSYSWQDAEDSDTGQSIPDAPGQLMKLNAYWEFHPGWSANLQAYRVVDRRRAADDDRPVTGNYNLMNLSLRRRHILPDLDMGLTLRNITNENAREPSSASIANDYPLEGRGIWLEFNYTFR